MYYKEQQIEVRIKYFDKIHGKYYYPYGVGEVSEILPKKKGSFGPWTRKYKATRLCRTGWHTPTIDSTGWYTNTAMIVQCRGFGNGDGHKEVWKTIRVLEICKSGLGYDELRKRRAAWQKKLTAKVTAAANKAAYE